MKLSVWPPGNAKDYGSTVIPPRTVTGGGGTIATQDEGISVDVDATTLNFVGAGVVATDAGAGVTTVTISGGSGSPGGSNTHIQYNDSSAFGGDSRLAFNETTKVATGQWAVDSNAINAQTGTTYTLLDSDNGKLITLSNASSITLTVPAGLGAGFNCMIEQLGVGIVTITPDTTTVESLGGLLDTAGRYGLVSLIARAANTFVASGALA